MHALTCKHTHRHARAHRHATVAPRPDKDRPLKVVLVATKTDLPTQRHKTSVESAQDWANANGMEFFATSAVRGGGKRRAKGQRMMRRHNLL